MSARSRRRRARRREKALRWVIANLYSPEAMAAQLAILLRPRPRLSDPERLFPRKISL